MNLEDQNTNVEAEETANVTPEAPMETPVAKTNTAHDDFDWDADEAGFQTYSATERTELEKSYTESFTPIEEKQVVKGKVTSINDRDVVINIGFKSDGLVSRQEFRDMPDLAIGDEVDVYVDVAEDAMGQLVLSRRKALQETTWARVLLASTNDEIVSGIVRSRTKGGLVVDVMGIDAFLPGSQIDTKQVKDFDEYINKTMDFKIVKVNEVYKNIVISHKILIEDDIEAQKLEILGGLEKGQVVEGIVKNMTNFGVFIDLGGIDGLLHITDISWGRINHPEEVLELEQTINVAILDFDDEKKRISLGLKQLTPHPWDSLPETVKEGTNIKGKVVSVADYGAFVEIMPGIEGLVHVSEMSWSSHLRNPNEYLKVDDEVEALVLALDKEEHKMSLGIKQLSIDPWTNILEKYAVDSKHKGIVKNLTSYGLFVELEEGVDGLVHVSDLSWNKKIKHPSEFIKKGEEIEVVVLEIDVDNRRLSIGHKQLEENPWETFETVFTLGSVHEGTIIQNSEKGANVQLPYGVEAFAPPRHMKKKGNTPVTEDETLEFEIIEFNKDQKRIIISHTNVWKTAERIANGEEAEVKEQFKKRTSANAKRNSSSNDSATLGELDALSELRAQLEQAEKKKAAAPKKEAAPKAEKKEAKPKAVKKEAAPKAEKKEAAPKAEKKEAKPKAEKKAAAPKAAKKTKAADLTSITGVGPAFAKRLNALGINSLADMAALTDAQIDEHEKKDSMTSLDQWHKWIKEAKTLA